MQRDGLTNPGNFVAHRQLLLGFARDFGALAAAYWVSGEERFAAAAVRLADAWFVNPATKMNPSLLYSRAIMGRSTGRSIGVIDTLHLAEVALGIEALRGSKAPDVMYWDTWPVRQPALLLGALATGRSDWLQLWKRLDPDSTIEEIRRNFPIRQPVLWVR